MIDGGGNGGGLLLFLIALLTIPLQFLLLSAGLLVAATTVGFAGFIATVLLVMSNSDLINPTLLALLRFFVVVGLFVSIPLSSAAAGAAALVGLVLAALGAIAGIFRGA